MNEKPEQTTPYNIIKKKLSNTKDALYYEGPTALKGNITKITYNDLIEEIEIELMITHKAEHNSKLDIYKTETIEDTPLSLIFNTVISKSEDYRLYIQYVGGTLVINETLIQRFLEGKLSRKELCF